MEANKDECIAFGKNGWKKQELTDPSIVAEYCAIEEGLNNMERLNIRGGLIRLDGQVKAFSFGKKAARNSAVIHGKRRTPISGACTPPSIRNISP